MHRLSLGHARTTEPGSQTDRAVTPAPRGPRPALCGLCALLALPVVLMTFSSTARAQGFATGRIAINPLLTNPAWATLVFAPAGTTLVVSPAIGLSFNATAGGAAPAAQKLSVSASTGEALPVSLSFTSNPSGWLAVDSTSGTTPKDFNVSVNPQGLGKGAYNGAISVASPGLSNTLVNVLLTLTESALTPQPLTVSNNASNQAGSIAPGELIVIKGTALGPTPAASFGLNAQGGVDPKLAGVRVLFGGVPGTPIYVSATQINVTVPWEIAGQTRSDLVVEYNGNQSAPITLRVEDVSPAIYTLNSTGSGQAVALNQNYTFNGPPGGATTPDGRGQVLILYATGGGVTNPPGTTGSVSSTTQLMPLQAKASATVGGQPATVLFAGAAPGLVTGVMQLNVQLPPGVTGNNLPVVITLTGANGTVQSPDGPTVAVQ